MSLNTRENTLLNTDERIFYISDDIDKSTMGVICFNLLFLLQEDDKKDNEEKNFTRKPIKIFINSFGGSVYDMWGLIDIISNSKSPIYTYCTGYCMSAAFMIFLSGHKRFAYKHSTFMYHQIYFWKSGKYQDLIEDNVENLYLQQLHEKWVQKRTNITEKQLKKNRERKKDWYIHSDEALELGIVHEIIK